MTEEQRRRGPAATQVEATGQHVQANVARLRKLRGLSTYQLAVALKKAGRPIPQSGISRIESGARRVDVDDLTALAFVLGVNANALLMPSTAEGQIELTGTGTVDASDAWDWAEGNRPLELPGNDDGTAHNLFQADARPSGRRHFIGHAMGRMELSPDAKAMIERDRARFERDTGERIDFETFARQWLLTQSGGSDG
ncbi:helix-turn-helix transcriptional regulator [Streptomyces sp. NPDC046853]|uniref:helix-turn-helix domain-containing protein n=1 Tax=Streptomyces sp. NPDC046853 TaxID=3154920 RepID=UPI00340665D7